MSFSAVTSSILQLLLLMTVLGSDNTLAVGGNGKLFQKIRLPKWAFDYRLLPKKKQENVQQYIRTHIGKRFDVNTNK